MTIIELEKRVRALEQEMAAFKETDNGSQLDRRWLKTFGMFRNDREFEEAERYGREYRANQVDETSEE